LTLEIGSVLMPRG